MTSFAPIKPQTSPLAPNRPSPTAAAPTKTDTAANAAPKHVDYTVKKGDTLTSISQAQKTSVDELMKANPQIKDKNLIFAGSVIKVPSPEAKPATTAETAAPADACPATPAVDPKVKAETRQRAVGREEMIRKNIEATTTADSAPITKGKLDGTREPTAVPATKPEAPAAPERAVATGLSRPTSKPAPAAAAPAAVTDDRFGVFGDNVQAVAQEMRAKHGLSAQDYATLTDGKVNDAADVAVVQREAARLVSDAEANGKQVTEAMRQRQFLLSGLGDQLAKAQARGNISELKAAAADLPEALLKKAAETLADPLGLQRAAKNFLIEHVVDAAKSKND
jgi:murein DD-endopeptidase MepM/ murein hydrolase activator NlpD